MSRSFSSHSDIRREAAHEAFDVAVLHGLAGLDVVRRNLQFETQARKCRKVSSMPLSMRNDLGAPRFEIHTVEDALLPAGLQSSYRLPTLGTHG
jgi:hypothetical protein